MFNQTFDSIEIIVPDAAVIDLDDLEELTIEEELPVIEKQNLILRMYEALKLRIQNTAVRMATLTITVLILLHH